MIVGKLEKGQIPFTLYKMYICPDVSVKIISNTLQMSIEDFVVLEASLAVTPLSLQLHVSHD